MKKFLAIALFVLSASVFAATPYSFKCTTGSDGSCAINSSNAHPLKLVETNVYGGQEGEYNLFYVTEDGSYMFVYKGETMLAQSAGSTYLAVPVSGGFVGVILANGMSDIPAFIKPETK